ncbi:acyl-CoA carboxylase subunit beta [Paralcaligenes ureilyticus]|uniref:Acetyl-CoA carboxylase carboxyltransferase component n=1 Tax=Paralcaligenes ureilyticus TaxID=627131 RepID=A0A4V2UXI8_9BURK|nr:carboxyl transferase domain-containing protein [Paralcaligenes ureilyticus]TCT03728.1 acetyl-CoA carboxylase carboxyltransferase component [Paralcaligenes ureilyticus]
MKHQALLDTLDQKRAAAAAMGGERKLQKRKETGDLNAQERLDVLVDGDSFIELGLLAASVFDQDREATPRDGKIVGFGKINKRDVGVVVNDFTTKGASTSATNSKKMGYIRKTCNERGIPFVHIGESTGARLPDAMGSKGMGQMLGNDTSQFRRIREVPWVAAALSTSFGSSAWLCCCADFSVMKKGSIMAVSSPRLVSMAIGEKIDLEELGGWRLHAEQTGLIDYFVDSDQEAMMVIRRFLSYMPSHANELAPRGEVPEGSDADQERILDIIPESRTQVYNMKKILEIVFDNGSLLELKSRFGKSVVTSLARLDGHVVGIIANNPLTGGGALSAEACRKAIDFTVLCDSFNVPIIRFVDTPGFVVGAEAERKGAPGQIMNFMNATCLTTVPQITVLCRKAYGRAYVAMGGGAHNDTMVAWPNAEVSFMDPVFATTIVHNKTAEDEGFEDALAEIRKDLEIWDMARIFSAHDVIKPQETRKFLIRMLEIHQRRKSGGISERLMRSWPTSY